MSTTSPAPGAWLAPVLASLGACLMVQAVAWHAGRALDRSGRVRWVARVYRVRSIAVMIALAGLGYGVLAGGYDHFVRHTVGDLIVLDDLLIASPVLVVIIAGWWSAYPIERRLREAMLPSHALHGRPAARAAHAHELRPLATSAHGLLLVLVPISMVIGWTDVVQRLPRWSVGTSMHAFFEHWEGPLHWAGILATLLVGPAILRALWDVHPLADSDLRTSIRAACTDARIRVRGPLVWRTGGTIVNGAILGILWPFRYLLFTDAMLERLTPQQLSAVLAHEIAHVRMRHMLWLGIAAGGAILALSWAAEVVVRLLRLSTESNSVLLVASRGDAGGGAARLWHDQPALRVAGRRL